MEKKKLEKLLKSYTKVYQMLEDEESRDIYINKINWLISGDYGYIRNIFTKYRPDLRDWTIPFERAMQDIKAALPSDRGIVLYGAGEFAPYVFQYWRDDRRLAGFCSRTKSKQKNGYCGFPVMSPEELLSRKDLSVIISVAADEPRNEIRQFLYAGNYPANQIYEIPGYLREDDEDQYFNPGFMNYEENEIFIDAGCCNLETSLKLKRYCKSVKKVYAFEPDPECYEICLNKKNEQSLSEVELLPFGTWSERTTLHFTSVSSGSSRICENGESSISVMPIDEAVAPNDKVTMIKMDVEGAELESLKGAARTIQRDKPKLAICIYHKPEDMTEIPLYIKELVPEYKLYIRHHSNYQWETVFYAVMS